MTTVFFITHPDVVKSPDVPVPRWPLSARGRERLSAMLARPWVSGVEVVYCSDEQKALDGAAILAGHLGLSPFVMAELGEVDRSSTGYLPEEAHAMVVRLLFERTEEGRALLKAHSPLTYADRIVRPLLIAQGANDPRVKQAESDQIVSAMQAGGIPVTYLLYPDEGHGFARPENNLSFAAIAEAFLGACLGGRVEPIGDDLAGSSVVVPVGGEDVPGLADALDNRPV